MRWGRIMCFHSVSRVAMSVVVVLALCGSLLALSKEDVYYGNYRQYKKAAEVNAKKVFMVIPAYKEIIEKDIDKDSALYLIKLAEANKAFLKAVSKYAKDNGYDLVCEEGILDNATSATDEVIKIIREGIKKATR